MHFIIDVRKMSHSERTNKVSEFLDGVISGDKAEILADDEEMLKTAPDLVKSTNKAEFIETWKGNDQYFHTLIKKY